ncbi:hypothetical protein AB4Y45_33050 [Paraburkholderia sp. EG287A]|uniref:hypothetical protein n=1 Tax=Paraburkholderia sp. EG287A TaxID=3237012 RepID=UPI0034D18B5A
MDYEKTYKRAQALVTARLGSGASALSQELFDGLVAREILVVISQNGDNPGYEVAAGLADFTLQSNARPR